MPEEEKNIYWNKTGEDAHWDTVAGNWWDDDAFTVQASDVPQIGDSVYLCGATVPDTGPAAPIEFFRFDTSGLTAAELSEIVTGSVSIAEGGFLTMGDPAAPGNSHYWGGTTGTEGTFVFNDAAHNYYGTVGDYSMWNGTASNIGTVGDYSTWNGTASNIGTVGDYSTWNDTASNIGAVGDFATVNSVQTQYGEWTGSTFYIGAAVEFDALCEFTTLDPAVTFYLTAPAATVTGPILNAGDVPVPVIIGAALTEHAAGTLIRSASLTLIGKLDVNCAYLKAGVTLDCAGNDVVLGADGRVTGFGTLANCVPVGDAIHVGPGIIDGTGNDPAKVIFDPWPKPAVIEL